MSLEIAIKKHLPSFDLDVSFTASRGVFGLLGASGCGKTMTMRCIAGIESPDEGHIVVNDEVFFDSETGINLSAQQRKTALLFQNYMLFPNLTVADNVAAGIPRQLPAEERRQLVERELTRFDVNHFAKRYPAQLSGGQQQRVALARMLAARPGILMLDEPFSALDAHLKDLLEQNLSSLFEAFEGTILYVSHDIDEAVRFCDTIAVMEDGRVREIDAARSLVDHPQSIAALKLSGVKNVARVQRRDAHTVYCPQWGIELTCPDTVGEDVQAVGVRAFHIERATAPGENVFRMRVDRAIDSRFDRLSLLRFLDRDEDSVRMVEAEEEEMRYLHQRLSWRVSLLDTDEALCPHVGDELLVRIPPERLHVVYQ